MRSRPLLLLLLALAGCGGDATEESAPDSPAVAFASGQLCILTAADTLRMSVELAENEEQRAYGLMERSGLDANAGMLFIHEGPQPPESGYWMFHTLIPLDIAYLGPDGEILAIRQMQPCTSPDPRWCDSYAAGVTYSSALEANQGYFGAHAVVVGDRVVRAGEPGCPRA